MKYNKTKLTICGLFALSLSIHTNAQNIHRNVAQQEWNYDSLGNHRLVVIIPNTGKVAKVTIPWRRRDFHPEQKEIIIIDSASQKRIWNVKTENISREEGTILFEPSAGAGKYFIYYMPYWRKGSPYYPHSMYYKDSVTANKDWLASISREKPVIATDVTLQSVNDFNNFDEMEQIATTAETTQFFARHANENYIVIPEDRMHPIKMTKDLPWRWIKKEISQSVIDTAKRGENFAFQLGLVSDKQSLTGVAIDISDLQAGTNTIAKSNIDVMNNEGVNWIGQSIHFSVNIAKGKIQPFWCLINVPEKMAPGLYKGNATIHAEGLPDKIVPIALQVNKELAINHGTNEPWKQTRLTWLNSKVAEKDALMRPYTPLQLKGMQINLLGRKISLGKNGFPTQLTSFFTEEMTGIDQSPKQILSRPIAFQIKDNSGNILVLKNQAFHFLQKSESKIAWQAINSNSVVEMQVDGASEFDGFMEFTVKLIAKQNIDLQDIALQIPMTNFASKYLMGLGEKGELRPKEFHWKWDVAKKNQDGAWLGNVNAGLQFGLRDQHYSRPLNTNFYLQKPLLLPTSWGNANKGGVDIQNKLQDVLINCYSGNRAMTKGDTLYYNFRLLITPFHPINTDFQWENRFVHKYLPVATAKADGATVINIHQGTAINLYINYPFIKTKEMKAYIDSAHAEGLKVKIYNTVRELSNRAYELPALFSLGNEIYSKGTGGGYAWLQEHLDSNYIPAWYTPEANDAAILNSGMSRWHNYYVEGMKWLTENIGIDGIYLDDVAFDRSIMKRIKKVMTEDNHPGIIDLHSANQYNQTDGFINSANLYMELFPYLNRLWFGEYFDYENNSQDFYLTEVSGIPFGLMGEMLQNNGNPYRGMLYGMTNRLFWNGGKKEDADPRAIWNIWDQFGIKGSKMIGYWVNSNPVKTNNKNVLATVYKKKNSLLIALASWDKNPANIQLSIDWKQLGWNPKNVTFEIPAAKDLQNAQSFQWNQSLLIQPASGKFILLKNNN